MEAVIYNEDEQQTGLNELGMQNIWKSKGWSGQGSVWSAWIYKHPAWPTHTEQANNKGDGLHRPPTYAYRYMWEGSWNPLAKLTSVLVIVAVSWFQRCLYAGLICVKRRKLLQAGHAHLAEHWNPARWRAESQVNGLSRVNGFCARSLINLVWSTRLPIQLARAI